jgi:ABC-2 type transport system permease protein
LIGRIFIIAWKELLQVRRDRLTLGMMALLPIMQLLLFGFAINTDVRHIPTLVYDQDSSRESRDIVRRMEATGFYDVIGHVDGYDALEVALRRGEARVGVVLPARFGSDVARGRPTKMQLIVDGSDPQTVASARDTAIGVAQSRSAEILLLRAEQNGTRTEPASPISAEPTVWYNPDLRTAVFIVPGLAGVILTLTMVMFTSMAIARERERGTLEQLIVSPIRRGELIVGKILPYVGVGYVQMTLILLVGRIVFGVRFVGDVGLLYVLAAAFIAANLALGLVFSTLAKTQQQAMQMSFFFLLPNILLSGFMFPWEGMPRPVQILSQILPLTHFLRIVRGVVLKGGTFTDLVGELYWLGGILMGFVLLAALRFQKKLA